MSPLGAPGDLTGFPSLALRAGTRLWRIHRCDRGPWWFSAGGGQRFDLPPPQGTLYAAEQPLGAFLEVFRTTHAIGQADVDARCLAALRLPRRARVADTIVARARRFGVTLELGSTPDYELTQAWASALAAAGFGGVRYRLRHDPTGTLLGVALFGDGGEADRPATSVPLPASLVAAAAARFGIVVAPDRLPG